MTNYEFLSSCSKSELADALATMITLVYEQITTKPVTNEMYLLECESMLKYLDDEFEGTDGYLN